jgi:NAD(P)H-flavin reductase/truncated hemoglobin YjbI
VHVNGLRSSWAAVAAYGDQVASYFYSRLFVEHPDTRSMFPLMMSDQRDKLVAALGGVVSNVDKPEQLTRLVEALGRDHRKFGAQAAHYEAVGAVLLATLEYFLADKWTPALAQDWTAAYGLVSQTMQDAARHAERYQPPYWQAEVVEHSRRNAHLAVVTVQPNGSLPFLPGQSISICTHLRPQVWRYLSPANAPRPDGTIEFHIAAIPGGELSTALVVSLRKGDVVRMGAPVGERLTLPADERRDLMLIAGGTGLAPLKAIVEQVAQTWPRPVMLVVGARHMSDLYDLNALSDLASRHEWLTILAALSDDTSTQQGIHVGDAAEVAARIERHRSDLLTYICGSNAMVQGSIQILHRHGWPTDSNALRFEQFDDRGYRPSPPPAL